MPKAEHGFRNQDERSPNHDRCSVGRSNAVCVGISSAEITPFLAEPKVVKTPIELRSAYFSDGGTEALWLIFDLMDLNADFVDAVQTAAAETCNIPKQRVHVVSTHNHGGGDIAGNFLKELAKTAAETACEARAVAVPARMRYVETHVHEQLNYIRRVYSERLKGKTTVYWGPSKSNGYDIAPYVASNILALERGKVSYSGRIESTTDKIPAIPGDDRLQALFFESLRGAPIGSICRFAAHAVCCNLPHRYSSDYPYHTRKTMEEILGGTAVFLNGPCAEIAPCAKDKTSGFELELGVKLGKIASRLLKHAPAQAITHFRDYAMEVCLPLRKEMAGGDIGRLLESKNIVIPMNNPAALPELKRVLERKHFLATLRFLEKKASGGDFQRVLLGKLVLNDVEFLAFPGETFNSTAERAVDRGIHRKVITVTEHGATAMYIVPEREYDQGGYEWTCCMVASDAESILIRAAGELLNATD